MLNRILNIVCWIGIALVLGAVAIRLVFPAREQWAPYLAYAGLACVIAYTIGQWREIAAMFERRQARYGTLTGASILIVIAVLVAGQYVGEGEDTRVRLTADGA